MAEFTYDKNREYFSGSSSMGAGIGLVIFGLILCFIWSWLWGGIICAVGALLIWMACGRLTDEQIDAQVDAKFEELDDDAFNKLGIDESEVDLADPVKFWGYAFEYPSLLGDPENNKARWITGKDGFSRSSEFILTGFYFAEDSVYCYEQIGSLVSDAVEERTEEYFYKDIVSVKTGSSKIPAVDENGNEIEGVWIRHEEFIITNMGGEKKVCTVANAEEAESAVTAFRALLKEKK